MGKTWRYRPGAVLLSLPLDGEGRTINDAKRANAIAVAFPATAAASVEAIYVFAHEAIGSVSHTAITDNVTPAEQRSGVVTRYDGTLFGVVALVLGFLHYRTRVSAGREQAALVFVGGQLAWLAIVLVQNGLFGTPK